MFRHLRLKRPISADVSMDLDDTLATKTALKELGHLRRTDYGLTPYPDQDMLDGLKSFQRAHGLAADGVMNPDGQTVKKLNAVLAARRRPEPWPPRPNTPRSRRSGPAVPVGRTRPVKLKGTVSAAANVDLDDSLALKAALADLGHLRPSKHGLSPYPDHALIDGLKAFQRQHGLAADGEARPDGPTVRKLNGVLINRAGGMPADQNRGDLKMAMMQRPGARPRLLEGEGYQGPTRTWGPATSGLIGLGLLDRMRRETRRHGGEAAPPASPRQPRTQIADPSPPVPGSEPPRDEDRLPTKTTLPRPRPDDLGPPTEIFPDPKERWDYIESFPDQSDLLLDYLIQENSRGDEHTQADNDFIVKEMGACLDTMGLRWTHTHGAHNQQGVELKERYISPIAGIGAARPDISIKIEDGQIQDWYEDFQTVSTWKDGTTPVARERRALQKIIDLKRAHGERGAVKEFPKSRGINREQWEKEMREAVWAYCEERYRPHAEARKQSSGKGASRPAKGPAGTKR